MMHRRFCPRFVLGLLVVILTAFSVSRANAQDTPPTDTPKANTTPGKPNGHMIPLGDFGADEMGYIAIPNTPPTVGIVMIPDAYGLDDFTKAEANRLAGEGFLVLAVDIYNGHLTTDPGMLANLTANLDNGTVMKAVDAGIRFFQESPTFHVDHIVTMGWGVGATYAFEAAQESKALNGAILFYGPILTDPATVKKMGAAVCAVYPENDPVATHEAVLSFQRMMRGVGNDCDAWFIAAGRGWSNPTSKTYNAAEDREAWKVAMPFLLRIGAEPIKQKSVIDKAKDKIESIFK